MFIGKPSVICLAFHLYRAFVFVNEVAHPQYLFNVYSVLRILLCLFDCMFVISNSKFAVVAYNVDDHKRIQNNMSLSKRKKHCSLISNYHISNMTITNVLAPVLHALSIGFTSLIDGLYYYPHIIGCPYFRHITGRLYG